jgi:uncharacterized protein
VCRRRDEGSFRAPPSRASALSCRAPRSRAARYHARMIGETTRREIVRVLRDGVPGLQLVILFGSHARGGATPASDVDVGFLASAATAPSLLRALRHEVELVTGSDVHLVDLRAASTVLRHEIAQQGERLHSVGGAEVESFLDFALRDYVRLNEERSGILRDIAERGRVHGR